MNNNISEIKWLKQDTTVYALGENGCNMFSFHVQTYGKDKIGEDELKAITTLASSAPQLLKALKETNEFMRRYYGKDDPLVINNDSVISQAKGEK